MSDIWSEIATMDWDAIDNLLYQGKSQLAVRDFWNAPNRNIRVTLAKDVIKERANYLKRYYPERFLVDSSSDSQWDVQELLASIDLSTKKIIEIRAEWNGETENLTRNGEEEDYVLIIARCTPIEPNASEPILFSNFELDMVYREMPGPFDPEFKPWTDEQVMEKVKPIVIGLSEQLGIPYSLLSRDEDADSDIAIRLKDGEIIMANDDNIEEVAQAKIAEISRKLKVTRITPIPGGWYIEHGVLEYNPVDGTKRVSQALRIGGHQPFILNKWTGDLVEVSMYGGNMHYDAMDFIHSLPDEQKQLALQEPEKIPYVPIRFYPFRLDLGQILDWNTLQAVTFDAEFDLVPLRSLGLETVPDLVGSLEDVSSVKRIESITKGDTVWNRYQIVFDITNLLRIRRRNLRDKIYMKLPENLSEDLENLWRYRTLWVEGDLTELRPLDQRNNF